VARSGPGRENAARATECLIDGHEPKWVLSCGFAGGLSPKLARHDLVMVDRLADVEGNRLDLELQVDREWLARTPGVHVGRLLTADRVVRLPDEKRSLGQKYEAVAVDMETFAAAEACRRRKTRFMAIRIISDAVDDELPEDIEKLLRQKTTAGRLGAAVGSIWRRPSSVKDMYRLKENALVASDKLAKFLAGVIGGLPSS
jgi:adenosylhomocysteine nucleosidase